MAKAGDCILFSTADWKTPYWTNKQHTARGLVSQGMRVLYVESIGLRAPQAGSKRDLVRLFKRLFRSLAGIAEVEINLWVLSPLVIPFKHHHPLVRTINQFIIRYTLERFIKRHGFITPLVWTYHPYILESLQLPHGKIVYHCVDDISTIPGVDVEAFHHEELRLLDHATHVFTTSRSLYIKCAEHHTDVHYFPNVADIEHFGRAHQSSLLPEDLSNIPSPRIAYSGVLSDFKVDFELINEIAVSHPEWHWVMIGEEREGQASPHVQQLRTLPNVHFLGHKDYALLPEYLRGMHVATLPTKINEYTASMFPMKYFEYLAAGVPVVSTALEFTKEHQEGLLVANNASEFIAAVEKQLARGRFTQEESCKLVGENTWQMRLNKMLAIIQ